MNQKTLIAGAGNPWRHDDGIGVAVIQHLQQLRQQTNSTTPPLVNLTNVELVDIGTDGFALLDLLPAYHNAIIIDAVEMRAVPGTIKVFTPKEAKIKIIHDALSTHGLGLAEMLKVAEQLNLATKIIIIGIQPQDLSFGEGLSPQLTHTVPKIINILLQHLTKKEIL